jgi:hypothetical protein
MPDAADDHRGARATQKTTPGRVDHKARVSVRQVFKSVSVRYVAQRLDVRLVAAIVDRLTFNAHIIETGTESYRPPHHQDRTTTTQAELEDGANTHDQTGARSS